MASNIAAASARAESGELFGLELIGAGRPLREETVPIQFRARGPGKGRFRRSPSGNR